MVKESIAFEYASWCMKETERKVGKYVKLQAKQWIEIVEGKNEDAEVSEEEYEKLCKILKLMMHPDLQVNLLEGLEPYALFLITATFCTKLKGTKYRYYQTVVLEIARKNYKTFNSAVIFIILMLTEPMFSRFYSVAPDKSLSSELKVAIKKIIKSSPLLCDEYDPVFKILRSQINCLITDSEYYPLAYSDDRMDGKLANAFLGDEAGAMDSYPIEAMRSSQITLKNKLGIVISTQYPNDENVFIDEIDISKKVLDELLKENKRRFSLLYEPDEDLLEDEDAWQTNDNIIYQSNPVAVTSEYIFDAIVEKREMAILYENKRENYLCKHNNIKYKGLGVQGYIEINKVKKCRWVAKDDFWVGKKVWIGLDLSISDDNTAVAMATEENENVYAKITGFIPADRMFLKSKKEGVNYKRLVKEGCCISCGTEIIDYKEVEYYIKNLEKEYGVEVQQVGYDRYNAIATIQALEQDGFECVEIKQHSSVLHQPTKLLKELILKKRFFYEENDMLEINFQNARCTEDTNLNKYVNKKKSNGKVDMVVALINAIYLLEQEMLFGTNDFVVQT